MATPSKGIAQRLARCMIQKTDDFIRDEACKFLGRKIEPKEFMERMSVDVYTSGRQVLKIDGTELLELYRPGFTTEQDGHSFFAVGKQHYKRLWKKQSHE